MLDLNKHNIPGPPFTMFFGTMKEVLLGRTSVEKYLRNIYDAYERPPFVGIFHIREQILIIKDPEHIKDVFIKDSALFPNRGLNSSLQEEPLKQFLFHANVPVAHIIRSKVSSAFTPSKLKELCHMMLESLERLDNYLEELLSKNNNIINCGNIAARLTADMTGINLMSINMRTLTRENYEENDFLKYTDNACGTYWGTLIKTVMIDICPRLYKWIDYLLSSNSKVTPPFLNFISDIIKYRKKHAIVKADILGLLMELKKNPGKLSEFIGSDVMDEFLRTQMLGFLYAGYETTAATICNTLYELASHPNIQDKLRKKILDTYAKNNGQLQYDDINAISYLNADFKGKHNNI
ncbi:PREDICTED: cytochrome P450 6B5-like [Dinoponera quadriceps]|uniref:Cytochrome P450 6B5-like n=1 Tax=Dinoponera quadriceps TaxID=609295 RepID=A0A6P3WX73_DINQU|nr:PREDICTED: cytochrome P450 6B5-like [Dinoponera quadriceps]